MTDDASPELPSDLPAPLPEAVRARVLALASERLGLLPTEEVPAVLARLARFTPARRRRLGAGPLAAVLETDPIFRQRVADGLRAEQPELVEALYAGTPPASAPPDEVAAAAYLLRTPGWPAVVARAGEWLGHAAQAQAEAEQIETVVRLTEQLDALRVGARAELDRVRSELAATRHEFEGQRRRTREEAERARRAEVERARVERDAAAERASTAATARATEAETRRLRARLADAESALEAARRAGRQGRSLDDVRLRVLLDTLLGAARGLGQELALAPVDERPADLLVAGQPTQTRPALTGLPARGLAPDDPALLDALLTIPGVHLVVDGYNVTKSAYGELPLEAQRGRLLAGLGALAAQTHAEVTCVFDGAQRTTPLAVAAPRGVRLVFSAPDETADEVVRRLVRAEPPGRLVVVVSSDREVADGVRRAGARPVPSAALARRLERA